MAGIPYRSLPDVLAADVVQEIFIKLWERYPSLDNDFNVKSLQVTEANVHRLKKLAYKKLKSILKDYYYLIFVFIMPE